MDSGDKADALGRALAKRANGATDPASIAAATAATLEMMASNLSPVIGARGFDVLLGRSLHLAAVGFSWLGEDWSIDDFATRTDLLADMQRRLDGGQASSVTDVSLAIFLNFSRSLAALIGVSLAERLLAPVRANSALLR